MFLLTSNHINRLRNICTHDFPLPFDIDGTLVQFLLGRLVDAVKFCLNRIAFSVCLLSAYMQYAITVNLEHAGNSMFTRSACCGQIQDNITDEGILLCGFLFALIDFEADALLTITVRGEGLFSPNFYRNVCVR